MTGTEIDIDLEHIEDYLRVQRLVAACEGCQQGVITPRGAVVCLILMAASLDNLYRQEMFQEASAVDCAISMLIANFAAFGEAHKAIVEMQE